MLASVARLYANCDWEKNAIRRLIADGRIAARQKGLDSPDTDSNCTEECPICFLNYSEVNTTNCCHASMCTECYLQVRPQKEKEPTCPFCNSTEFSVFVDKKKTPSEVCPSETETSLSDSSSSTKEVVAKKKTASVAPSPPKSPKIERGGFGSQLEKDERFQRMRKRSESFASQNSDGPSTPKRDQDIIQSIAMSSEERQRLEEEMKAQHQHPLVLRLENEAQIRRLENDRAYQNSARSQSASRNSHLARRVRAARNWDQLANFFDQREELNNDSSMESAILYSRLAEARGASGTNSDDSNEDGNNHQDQLEGFHLLRTLLTGQIDNHQTNNSRSSSRSLRSSRRQRHPFIRSGLGMRSRGGMSDVAMATASLMMRGISEEEQMAMAIAASMRDQEQPSDENDQDDDEQEDDQAEETNSNDVEEPNHEKNEAVSEAQAPTTQATQVIESKQVSGDVESAITELARVVTDHGTDTILNGISA